MMQGCLTGFSLLVKDKAGSFALLRIFDSQ